MPTYVPTRPQARFVLRIFVVLLVLLSPGLAFPHPVHAGAAHMDYAICIYPAVGAPAGATVICEITADVIASETWLAKIPDNRDPAHPVERSVVYYIKESSFVIGASATLTIEGGAVVKVAAPHPLPESRYAITVNGTLVLNGTQSDPVVFTSGRDDEIGGDSNRDGIQTLPGAGDWEGLILVNRSTEVAFVTMRYARYGLQIKNTAAAAVGPAVHHSLLARNYCGLTLTVTSSGGINSQISNNNFQENLFGFCTEQEASNDTGLMTPALQDNLFERNRQLPIYLRGTAFPTYSGNTIKGYDPTDQDVLERHLGIGLGGTIHVDGAWAPVKGISDLDMPYVVVGTLEIKSGVTVTVPAGTIFKFYTAAELPPDPTVLPDTSLITEELPGLTVNGTLNLPRADNPQNPLDPDRPVIFTSYRDDSAAGDTNGDGTNTSPGPGDWFQVAIIDALETAAPQPVFQHLEFRYGFNGLYFETTKAGSQRSPRFNSIKFTGNVNGLRLVADTSTAQPSTRITPDISDCTFEKNGRIPKQVAGTSDKYRVEHGVPIYLENNVHLAENFNDSGNTFTQNLHPAIGVAGFWRMSATWQAIVGQGMDQMPYLAHDEVVVGNPSISGAGGKDDSVVLSLPAGTVVKFNAYVYDRKYQSRILAPGILDLQSGPSSAPIVFTSIYDDFRHDTSADPTPATRTDWLDVETRHPDSHFINVVISNAEEGLHLRNLGTYELGSPVTGRFVENTIGLYMDLESSGDITSRVEDSTFTRNDYGLVTFALASKKPTGISRPVLDSNHFEFHCQLPIYLNGSASPEYLRDPATQAPTNTFANNTHRAIGLGGYFGSNDDPIFLPRVKGDTNAPFNGKVFPYVVWDDVTFDWNTQTTMDGGLVVKAVSGKFMKFFGKLTVNTQKALPNYFTAYEDDYYDDTDAHTTPTPPTLTRKKWDGVYLYNPNTLSFSYTTIKHATYGLVLFQDGASPGDIAPDLIENTYEQNNHGLSLWIESAYDILPWMTGSKFLNNDYGLYTYTNPKKVHTGTANPILLGNTFDGHFEFPIYLNGTADPVYGTQSDANSFQNSAHPAIAVSGYWSTNDLVEADEPTATWTQVQGDHGIFPYVVVDDVIIEMAYTTPDLIYAKIALPANTLVKFDTDCYIYSYGKLMFLSSPGSEVTFTSYRDDGVYHGIGGDTNADGTKTKPVRNHWNSVWLIDIPGKYHEVHDTLSKYAVSAFVVFYRGVDDNANIITSINRATMDECHSAVSTVVGWQKEGSAIYGGRGSIYASLSNIVIEDSNYGLLTVAHSLSTGINRPTLTNVTFRNIAMYPIFLGGTSQPIFNYGNQVSADATFLEGLKRSAPLGGEQEQPAVEMTLAGDDLPGNAAGQLVPALDEPVEAPVQAGPAQIALSSPQELFPAVALGGMWNNTVVLPAINTGNQNNQIPYAVVGDFPVDFTIGGVEYTPTDDVTVGEAAPAGMDFISLGIQPGTIFKFNTALRLTVKSQGDLAMQSTAQGPAIFTSFKDDSAGGDTNRDGVKTRPAAGDWLGLVVSSKNPAFSFHDANLRYASEGLHLFYDGPVNTRVTLEVSRSTFLYNGAGLTLTALMGGDVSTSIQNNRFAQNSKHIWGKAASAGYQGRLLVTARSNNLEGNKTQVGILNENTADPAPSCTQYKDCDFDAVNNYWGAASGPYHLAYNKTGQGTTVSDRVNFRPWLNDPMAFDSKYNIRGRITEQVFPYDGMQGVKVLLMPANITANTDVNGYYEFLNVDPGAYTLVPYQSNHAFEPAQIYLNLISDASGLNFQGYDSPGNYRKVTVAQAYAVLRPFSGDYVLNVQVSLDAANNTGAAIIVEYETFDGTATSGQDYTGVKKTLTFKPGERVKNVQITIKRGSSSDSEEYFTFQLSLPANCGSVQMDNAVTVINIVQPEFNYLPVIRH